MVEVRVSLQEFTVSPCKVLLSDGDTALCVCVCVSVVSLEYLKAYYGLLN